MINKHIKDKKPEETISRIRHILEKHGILIEEPDEVLSFNYHNRFYSFRIRIKGTNLGVNGKGITKELAKASALAEFMERLQNFLIFEPSTGVRVSFNPSVERKFPFHFDTNEKLLSPEDFPDMPSDFKVSNLDDDFFSFWENYKKILITQNKSMPFLPFYNVFEENITYLPVIIKSIYGSNGMAAGNTPEEAIVQGLSEILERYVMTQIYLKEIALPSVPEEYLKKYTPRQYSMIKSIEKTGDYRVIVKDCSLGKGFPVTGVIFLLRHSNKYAFKLGSDPDIAIALERCLTEFFQGKDTRNMDYKMLPIDLLPSFKERNIEYDMVRVTNGQVNYPDSIFEDNLSFSSFTTLNSASQKERLKFLLDFIKKRNHNIYIRDVSFLGFNSYYIIIPGMSEVSCGSLKLNPKRDFDRMEYLSKLSNLDNSELEKLAIDLEGFIFKNRRNLTVNDYLGGIYPSMRLNLSLLISVIYYKLGDFEKSYKHHVSFLENLNNHGNIHRLYYFQAVKEFLCLSTRYGRDVEKKKHILMSLFDKDTVRKVIHSYEDINNFFNSLSLPPCWNCDACSEYVNCPYKYVESIYITLKEHIKKNPVNQMGLKDVFSVRDA